jgi:hypothetical protein
VTIFSVAAYQNEYLPIGGRRVDGIVTATASRSGGDAGETSKDAAVVLLLDTSGSMQPRAKWHALQRAAEAAVMQIRDGAWFGIVAGSDVAEIVYPGTWGLAQASPATRADAVELVSRMRAGGGTAIGRWLVAARDRLAPYEGSIRQAILITDGQDESETREELYEAVKACVDVFQCDCRGVGVDWRVEELRWLASCLMGSVDIVADPDDMPADFESMMRHAMGRRTADLRLRLWTPRGASVASIKQVSPTVEDLTPRSARVDDKTVEFPTGAWGDESRDYHVVISVPEHPVGDEMLAGRLSLMVDGAPVADALLKAIWTNDSAASTRINDRVAHYTDQAELASAIDAGLSARARGDVVTATARLGLAVRLAASSGNDDTLRLLGRVVDVVDAPTGTVRLRTQVDTVDEMTLHTRSTRTVRVRGA